MIRLYVGNDLYKIKFHSITSSGVRLNPDEIIDGIECIIYKNENVVAKTQSYCSPTDTFVKAIGRNISFTRAMAFLSGSNNKGLRDLLWKEYFKLSPKSIRYMDYTRRKDN
jgi:hypothetical protein